jgi:hypothetical protein
VGCWLKIRNERNIGDLNDERLGEGGTQTFIAYNITRLFDF